MRRDRKSLVLRLATSTVASLAWFVISNHCTIVSATEQAKPRANACPMHASAPAHGKAPAEKSGDQLCCKSLKATPAKLSLARVLSLGAPVLAVLSDRTLFRCPAGRASPPLCLDTGPPWSLSFSELVLQRSLLAHAPPLLA